MIFILTNMRSGICLKLIDIASFRDISFLAWKEFTVHELSERYGRHSWRHSREWVSGIPQRHYLGASTVYVCGVYVGKTFDVILTCVSVGVIRCVSHDAVSAVRTVLYCELWRATLWNRRVAFCVIKRGFMKGTTISLCYWINYTFSESSARDCTLKFRVRRYIPML
jgi:hypothetical protein